MITAPTDIAIGVAMWMLVMVIPLLMIYVNNVEVRTSILVLVYPNLIALLARNGRFWISQPLMFGASLAAFTLLMLLRMIPSVREALKDPEKDKPRSAGTLAGVLGLFFLILIVGGTMSGMYNNSVMTRSNRSYF